jgi:hypothetical protein
MIIILICVCNNYLKLTQTIWDCIDLNQIITTQKFRWNLPSEWVILSDGTAEWRTY